MSPRTHPTAIVDEGAQGGDEARPRHRVPVSGGARATSTNVYDPRSAVSRQGGCRVDGAGTNARPRTADRHELADGRMRHVG